MTEPTDEELDSEYLSFDEEWNLLFQQNRRLSALCCSLTEELAITRTYEVMHPNKLQ